MEELGLAVLLPLVEEPSIVYPMEVGIVEERNPQSLDAELPLLRRLNLRSKDLRGLE